MTVQWLQPGKPLPYVEGQDGRIVPFDVPFVGEVAINGSTDEWWDRGLEVALLGDENNQHPPIDQLSAEARIGWNHDGLVVALRVRDDTTIEHPESSQIWAGDSVLLFVSDGLGSNNRYQAMVSPGRDPAHPEPRYRFTSSGAALPAGELAVVCGRVATDSGYEIEILLPWDNLPEFSPRSGAHMALQIYVNDRRVPANAGLQAGRQRLIWYPEIRSHANPNAMHGIRLVEDVSSAAHLRLLYNAALQSIEVYGPGSLSGDSITLRAGNQELGNVLLSEQGYLAYGQFPLPSIPEGRQWGPITAYQEGTLIGIQNLPRTFTPPQAAEIRYWPAGVKAKEKRSDVELLAIAGWNAQFIQRVELTHLEPGTDYQFQVETGGPVFGFRTMPAELSRPLRVAVGGDTGIDRQWMERTNRVAMRFAPDLIVWGGDLAYADGHEGSIHRWIDWFEALDNTLVDRDGRIVPIVPAIGNHEVQRGYYRNHIDFNPTNEWRLRVAPFFYQFFAFPSHPGYATLDFGDYMSFVILDSDHTNPVEGQQTAWLQHVLSERAHVPHVFPVYHVPGFPSHRDYEGQTSTLVREHWVPLFESHGVAVAFENHDHTYKRTVPIKHGEPNPSGVVYLGDGAWGVHTRATDAAAKWYIERSESARHAIIMTVDRTHRHFLVVREDGEVIDEIQQTTVLK